MLLAVDDIGLADAAAQEFLVQLVQALPGKLRLVVAGREPWDLPYQGLSSNVDLMLVDAPQMLLTRRDIETLRGVVRSQAGRDAVYQDSMGWPIAVRAAVGRAMGAQWASDEEGKLAEFINRAVLHSLSEDQWLLLKASAAAAVSIPRHLLIEAGEADPDWLGFPLLVEQNEPYQGIKPVGLLHDAIAKRESEQELGSADIVRRLAEELRDLECFTEAVKVAALLAAHRQAELLLFLGPALVAQGHDELALAAFEKFTNADLARWPTLVLARSAMSGVRGDTAETLAWLQQYADEAGDHPEGSELGQMMRLMSGQFREAHPTLTLTEVGPAGWPRMLMHLIASFQAYADGDENVALHHQIAIYRTSGAYPLLRIQASSVMAYLHLRAGRTEEAERALWVAHGLGLQDGLSRVNSTALVNAASVWLDCIKGNEKTVPAHLEHTIRKLDGIANGTPLSIAVCQIAIAQGALASGDPGLRSTVLSYLNRARAPIGGRVGAELDALQRRLILAEPNPQQHNPLTRAEVQVLHHLSTHLSLPQVAAQMHLSPATVRSHAHAIYRKFGVNSRAEAVNEGRRLMLLPPG